MRNFQRLNETMTDDAFEVLYMLLPPDTRICAEQIKTGMGIPLVRVELILQQMIEFHVAKSDAVGRYMLTPEYRKACGK
ncbi:hypothetical protein B7L51_000180 [Pectobacterium brasiliense]|uniref:hypothetical protein n=1 Tax=Pectobacterium brasiliense TaxID=180957 RepID=UPI0011401BB7|nr:hypothetical protein [Pectobacterium carotovorum]